MRDLKLYIKIYKEKNTNLKSYVITKYRKFDLENCCNVRYVEFKYGLYKKEYKRDI